MQVSVLQWNVQSSEPFQNICRYLDSHRPDVICLQELTIGLARHGYRDGPRYLAKELGYQCCFVELPNIAPDGSRVTLANAVLVDGQIEGCRPVVLSSADGSLGFEHQSRGYVEAALSVRGTVFTVGTVHLGYSRAFMMTERRKAEARALHRAISPDARRFVLTGDFNAEPDSYVITQVGQRLKSAGPGYELPTWTTKPFHYQDFAADELRWRLDYIFVSQDVEVVHSEILPSPFSDHLPILCQLELG